MSSRMIAEVNGSLREAHEQDVCGPARRCDPPRRGARRGAGARFPSRTIKIVVPVPPGSAADILPRIVAENLSARWGQPVIVENRLGGALNIAAEAVAKAEPDGYILLATPAPPLAINQSLYAKLSFDPGAFVPVTVMAATPLVLVAGPTTPFATFKDFVAYAKANPGKLTYASSGAGSTPHLAMELLKAEAGIDLVHVPYKGLVPTDLLAGHVDVMFNILGNTLPHVRSGALKLLAAGSDKRIAEFPEAPAVAEFFPGVVASAWFALAAPPRTPPAIADRTLGRDRRGPPSPGDRETAAQ